MVGTGVFTSIGFQALGLTSPLSILLLWLVGGVLALCGALTYGEVAARIPRSGGEYAYLSTIYHPALGFVSGVVSLIAGFAAPIAAAAFAFGDYLGVVAGGGDGRVWGTVLVLLATLLHSLEVGTGARAQNVFTALKVTLILVFIGLGLTSPVLAGELSWRFLPAEVGSEAFAVSLVYVALAYSGWNAAVYIAAEVREPTRTIPRALVAGTAIVLTLYVLLNYVFLRTVPMAELASAAAAGNTEFGALSARALLGTTGGQVMAGLIALGLVSAVSSMVMVGPRVTASAGDDFSAFRYLARRNRHGVPARALLLQLALALLLLWTQRFNDIVKYVGFTLSLFTFLTVLGVFVLRRRGVGASSQFRVPLYPVLPLVFLVITGWMLYYLGLTDWRIALAGGATLALGFAAYLLVRRRGEGPV